MKLPGIWIGNIQLLRVMTTSESIVRTDLFMWRQGKCVRREEGHFQASSPLYLLVTGAAVLQKEYETADGRMDRIIGNEALIVEQSCTEEGNVLLTFMRKEMISGLLAGLQERKLDIFGIRMDVGGDVAEEVWMEKTGRLLAGELTVRCLFHPGIRGGQLADIIYRRLRLPLLLLALGVLSVNFCISASLEESCRRQETVLEVSEHRQETENRECERVRQLSSGFEKQGIKGCAVLLDRVARCVPAGVRLSALELIPLHEKLRTGRQPELGEGVLLLKGETFIPEQLTLFCQLLSAAAFCRELHLNSLSRVNDSGKYRFEIDVKLQGI